MDRRTILPGPQCLVHFLVSTLMAWTRTRRHDTQAILSIMLSHKITLAIFSTGRRATLQLRRSPCCDQEASGTPLIPTDTTETKNYQGSFFLCQKHCRNPLYRLAMSWPPAPTLRPLWVGSGRGHKCRTKNKLIAGRDYLQRGNQVFSGTSEVRPGICYALIKPKLLFRSCRVIAPSIHKMACLGSVRARFAVLQ